MIAILLGWYCLAMVAGRLRGTPRDRRAAPVPTTPRPAARTMSLAEAAALLGVAKSSAYHAAARGELPGIIRLGRRIVVSRDAIERLLAGDSATPAGAVGHRDRG
jgi:excisionase family DNA binding protein